MILIDEAQWLRNPRRVSRLLAHIYDYHYDKATLMITGSAVGVMRSILEPSAKSPFYGRALTTMEIGRWSGSTSLSFLERGCKEAGKEYDVHDLSLVVERLDGIPSWLTLFGYIFSSSNRSYKEALKKTEKEAFRILKEELENVGKLSLGWKRQISILQEIAETPKKFNELGRDLGINHTALSHNLDMLHRLCYVTKNQEGKYSIIDPLVSEYLRQGSNVDSNAM